MLKRSGSVVAFGITVFLSIGTASAQNLSPFAVAAPGQWVVAPRFDVLSVPFHGLTYGQVRADGPGSAIIANIFDDDSSRSVGVTPAIVISRGFSGFGGTPAEIYGRFNYTSARASSNAAYTLTGAQNGIIAMVAPGPISNEGAYLTGVGTPITGSLDRKVTSVEGGVGVRAQYMVGSLTLIPGFEFAYQRLESDDDVSVTGFNGPYASSLNMNTDYYQFAVSLSALLPIAPHWSLVGSARTSYDYARARLSGTSVFTAGGAPLDNASATDTRTFSSNHTTLQAGFVFTANPVWSVSVLGVAQYISAVPGTIFPIYNFAAGGAVPLNGITSIQIGDFAALTSYGGSITASARF